jgi:hypothetical protein
MFGFWVLLWPLIKCLRNSHTPFRQRRIERGAAHADEYEPIANA